MKKSKIIPSYFFLLTLLVLSFSSCNGQTMDKKSGVEEKQVSSTYPVNNYDATVFTLDKNIRSIFQDSKGSYWFGTNGAGVFRYDGKIGTQFTTQDGLADNQVIHIQEDGSGIIWLGTGGFGITKFDGTNFNTLTNQVKITNSKSTDWTSKNSDLWFYAGGGVFRYSDRALAYLPFDTTSANTKNKSPFSLSRYAVYCILKDKKGNVWFGTQAEGVCRYDGQTLTWFKEKGLAGPAVLGLFEDSKGNLWFGNNGAGLFRYDGKTLTNFTAEKGLNNADFRATGEPGEGTLARVYSINEDNTGNLWIGTVDAGVWKYDGENLTQFTTKDGLTSNAVNTIYKDNNGVLWFGTDGDGINLFNGTRFYEFQMK